VKIRNACKSFVGINRGKALFQRLVYGWDDNINMDLRVRLVCYDVA